MVLCFVGCEVEQRAEDIFVVEDPGTLQAHVPTELLSDDLIRDVSRAYPSLVFSDYRDDCWHLAQLKFETSLQEVNHPSIMCFESYNKDDVSPNQQVSLLHTLQRGMLEDGVKVTALEKYACHFIDLRSGNISDAHSSSVCGGEWSYDNSWVVDEDEHYTISELF